jgi:hypothetical protein
METLQAQAEQAAYTAAEAVPRAAILTQLLVWGMVETALRVQSSLLT